MEWNGRGMVLCGMVEVWFGMAWWGYDMAW